MSNNLASNEPQILLLFMELLVLGSEMFFSIKLVKLTSSAIIINIYTILFKNDGGPPCAVYLKLLF